jgi:hypothetical protein
VEDKLDFRESGRQVEILQFVVDLRELARKIGNRLAIRKMEGIEPYSKLYKLPRALLPTSPEYIKHLIYPGLRFNLLVVIILVLTPDRYTGTPLLLCPD